MHLWVISCVSLEIFKVQQHWAFFESWGVNPGTYTHWANAATELCRLCFNKKNRELIKNFRCIFTCMSISPAWKYARCAHAWCPLGQKRASDLLGLELHVVVSHSGVRSSARARAPNCWANYSALKISFKKIDLFIIMCMSICWHVCLSAHHMPV